MISAELIPFFQSKVIEREHGHAFPQASLNLLAEQGLLKITLPGNLLANGKKATPALLKLLANVGQGDLCVGRVYEGHINAIHLIELYATDEQKRHWHKELEEHQYLFGVWNTEAAGGVKMHSMGNGRYKLSGAKTFCSGAEHIRRPLVTCQLETETASGWQMCIIPVEKVNAFIVDTSFWNPPGMQATHSYRLDFTGVELNEDDLLGKPGDYYKQPAFTGGAIRFAAVQLGAAEAVLNATIKYLKNMGRTEDAFQKARVGEMIWLISSGHQWLRSAGEKMDNDAETTELTTYANMTRTAIEEICNRCMELAERSVGARGLMEERIIAIMSRDLRYYLRQPAPDSALTAIADFAFHSNHSAHELWR